jgi:WD40 repeat protein
MSNPTCLTFCKTLFKFILRLQGHTANAEYALDWAPYDPIVASGGSDCKILLWNVEDYFNTTGKISDDNSNSSKSGDDTNVVSRAEKNLQSYLTDSKP